MEKLKIIQSKKKEKVRSAEALLTALNPVRILKRGYSITRTLPQGKIVRSAEATSPGQPLEIQLAEGQLEVLVDKIGTNKGQ